MNHGLLWNQAMCRWELPPGPVQLFHYDPTARHTDPITSHQAAASAKQLQTAHCNLILGALMRGPAGKDAIASITKLSGVQVCRRLPELEKVRAIRPTGRTVASDSGRQEREWEIA